MPEAAPHGDLSPDDAPRVLLVRARRRPAAWLALITLVAVLLWTVALRESRARLSGFFGVVIG